MFAVVFARFDEIPTMTVQVIQETKRPKGRKEGWTTRKQYTQNTVCGGYKKFYNLETSNCTTSLTNNKLQAVIRLNRF